MIIPGVILGVGTPREFTVTNNGLQKQQKAVELTIASGNNVFLAEGFGDVADAISQRAQQQHLCVAELVFSVRAVPRKDGNGVMAFLKATVTNFTGF